MNITKMDMFFENLRAKLKELRKSLDLTQTQFAERLEVTQITVSRWENGERIPTFENLANIAKLANKDLYYFFHKENESEKEHDLTKSEALLLAYFRALNSAGQERALEHVELLSTKYSASMTSKVS